MVVEVKPIQTGAITIGCFDVIIQSGTHEVTVAEAPTVNAPSAPNASVSETGEAVITWMDPSGEFTGINIEGNGATASVAAGVETWTDPNTNTTGESYRIQAYLDKTGCSFTSDWVSVDVPEPPRVIKPSNLQASKDRCDGVIHLSWNYNGEVEPSAFRIRRDGSVIASVNGDIWEYNDPVGEYETHDYQIKAIGILAGDETDYTTATEGSTTGYPSQPTLLSATQVGNTVEVDWTSSAHADKYILVRSSNSSTIEKEITGATSYTDDQVNNCERYKYELYAANECTNQDGNKGIKAAGVEEVTVLSDVDSYITGFDVSKAYFPDKVLLEWNVEDDNLSLVDEFIIKRRKAGSGDFEVLATVQSEAAYEDNSAIGGMLYEYQIYGRLECGDQTLLSNTLEAVGFRTPYGIVSGNVSYESGQNVKAVEILAEKEGAAIGTSIYFNGGSLVTVEDDTKLNPAEFITLEAWIRPESVSGTASIIDKESGSGYRLYRSGNDVVFGVNVAGSWVSVTAADVLTTNDYTHVAGVKDSTGVKIYINGKVPFSTSYLLESADIDFLNTSGVDPDVTSQLQSVVGTEYTQFSTFQADLSALVGSAQAERLLPLLMPVITENELIAGTHLEITGNISHNGGDLTIGDGFQGNIDEIRIWNQARDDEQVLYDYKRLVGNDAPGIAAYWRCDENFGDHIYDASKSNGEFHKNDGVFSGVTWSETIPAKDLLSWMGKTDTDGNYTIPYIPYTGSGENFTLTPRYEQHQFSPNTKTVFLGEGSTILNGQDFTDISSFKVTGTVFYANTTCGVEGAIVGVDGEPVIVNGQPVFTNQNGEFEISVPVGEHFVNVSKTGHEFRSYKFPPGPEDAKFNFQEHMTGINFIDETTITVTGRVVGGTREGDKKPGLGLSNNNIGVAQFNFESATGPGCSSYTVQTDPETGEFTVEMPPMVYLIKDFDVPKNPAVATYFSEFPEADFSIVNTEQTATHTFSGLVDAVVTIDTDDKTATMEIEGEDDIIHISDVEIINDGMTARFFYNEDVKQYPLDTESTVTVIETEVMGNNKTVSASYNYRYDLIYRTPPQIRVTAVDTVSPFTGEETVLYEDPVSKTMKEFNLKDNPLYYPVFVQGRDYSLMVFAEEVYLNQDVCDGINGCEEAAEDRVAVSDGVVNINNHLAIERNPAPLPLNNGRALYSFKGGEPNLLKDSNFPWRDYTNVLNISVNVDNVGYEWKPVETEADLGFSLPEGEPLREDDQYFRGYVLGTNVIEGNDFITNGPAVVDMILRDPPGSESYSFLEKGSSFSFEKSLSTSSTLTESYNTSIQLGAEFETGMGFITETEVEATTDIGFTATQTWNSDKTLTTEYTTTQSWQTSASPELAGAPSDLFLGSSKNFIVSLADNLTLLPDTFASRVGLPTAGRESAGMKIALNKSLVAAPSGESTHFIYTADHIENYLIPNLIAVRNNLFTNDAAYTSNIPISHELYGSNNDDARWGDQATTDDPVNTDTEKDYNGPSYTFIPPDSVTVMGKKVPKSKDMIRNYNQQIRLWREALERNEMEKYHAGLIKNISFDAGPTFEQSTETTVTQSHTTSFEASYNPEVALSVGGTVGGIGVFSTMGMSFNYSTGKTSTQTASQTNTFGYTLHDPDQGDYFSVDIKDAGTGTGPIFSIKGGRSMCPHEKTSPLKYYRPTEHIIGMGTLVELTGMNAAEDFRKILAWGENTGEYTFSEIKDVFDITDATKELIPDGAVFTIEQIYDRQFKNKLDLATAVEGLINLQLDLSLGENQEFGDDVAGNLEDMDQSDIREMSDQIEMDENNGFSRIYIFTSDQREQLLKEWARYRNYIYEITGSPLNDAEPTGNSTIRREVPKVSISPALRQNIPDDNLAYFTIQFGNDSYTDEGMTYIAQVLDNTNPDGAVIKMDGGTVNRSVTVGGGEQVNKTISVGMGKPDVYEYNNIQIVFYSPCEWEYSGNGSPLDPEAIDTVTFSVHFVPSCTNVEVVRPKNQFIINTDDEHMVNGVKETKVPILMSGYDLNNDIFEKLNFQFKSAANPDWIKTEDFYVVAENDELEIPGNFTAVEWDLSGYPDGEYNLRAKTYCGITPDGSEIFDLSEVWTGVVDRKPPQVFGTPQPADGILSPDDDIIIEFNEEIYSDKLTKLENFDIRGILNGTDLRHDVSVAFDDNTADFVRIPEGINLVGKSFTIEFWMKTQRAYQNECIFSQNTDPENAIQIMLTGNGEVEFQVGDQTYSEDRVNTADIIDEWHHWTFVYDDVRGEAIVMMDGVPLGTGPLSPAYTGYGDAYLGKAMAGDRYPFKGNLHELRIWERPRTASSVTANMLVTLSGKETGLIGYWPFDDAYGNLAVEKVHRRNATINAPWDITPNGYAATFESNGQGMLDMDFSDVAFGEEENFTIEFWFKSGQGTNTCLLSNGYGDENDMALYYYSVYDLALTADVLPLEENVEQTLSPMINEIYSDQEVFLSDIGNLIGADKAEKYREQLLRFGKHMPTYWSINTDTYGNIQVNNNGKRIKTEGEDFFDNRWHHFALVVQRVGNTRLYIDGELKVSEPSTEWNGFGAARLFVGARGLFNQNNPGYEFDQYFNGSMDELRIWNTALKQSQIERNSTMRLDGDELGLVAYFPFESYEEVMGVPNIEGNTRDMMTPDSVRNVSSNTAVFTQNTNVPNVRMKRPSSKVDFSFVAQEERVAFVLNEPNAKIENCILDITVQNVEDMYGNKMNSPATWSAYVDMNQVKWNKQQIDVEKEIYEPLTFTAKVINSSGLQQNFSFENLPGWLTASPNAGTLDPLTEQEITFTVDEGTNVGQYSQNIHLQTDFDFDEKLMVNLRVTKPLPPDWEINPEEFEHSMNVIGMVTINNVISTDKYDKAAAFVDGKCRGIANLKYIPEYDMYEVFLDVYSNQVAGEYFELHIWDASEGRELRKVQADGLKEAPVQYDGLYEFVDNSIYGLPSSPINLEANNIIIQKIPMTAGWNWKSFNLTMNRNMPLGNQFEGLDSERGDMVKGLTKYSEYSSYWVGTLNYLEPEDMYMFKVSKNDTLKVSGVPVNPATTPVEIVEGWNWIGYTPQVNISINDALGKFTPNHGDLLKSQFSFAMYDELMGWVGTLTFLMPNEGYKYKYIPQGDAPLSQQLFYPEEGTVLKSAKLQGEDEEIPSIPSYSKFQDNMPLVAIIDMPTDKQNEQDELAVYSNSELRGISSPIRLEDGRLMYFVSVYGNQATDTLTLQFKNEKGEIFDVHETLHYKSSQILGTTSNPVILTVDTDNLLSIDETISYNIYPNPFNAQLQVDFSIPAEEKIEIEIIDIVGKPVSDKITLIGSDRKAVINTSVLKSGIYMVKLSIEGSVFYERIIKE